MSRGPGKWQRLILEAVEEAEGWVWLQDITPPIEGADQMTSGEWVNKAVSRDEAIARAARTLWKKGLIMTNSAIKKQVHRGGKSGYRTRVIAIEKMTAHDKLYRFKGRPWKPW